MSMTTNKSGSPKNKVTVIQSTNLVGINVKGTGTTKKTYEIESEWEKAKGTVLERTIKVSTDARKVYAQQASMLPTITMEFGVPPESREALQTLGKKVLILEDTTKHLHSREFKQQLEAEIPKRVIPSRYGNDDDDLLVNGDEDEEEDEAIIQGRIDTILLDQEWDTRCWTRAKIQGAIDTLYFEIEHSDQEKRRTLATTMLIRLLETHEDAVDHVESTIQILMNKTFRNITSKTNKVKLFRMAKLLAILAQWFPEILIKENAVTKSIVFCMKEADICIKMLQHHWRGVCFEKRIVFAGATTGAKSKNGDSSDIYDAQLRARLRSMHLVKFVELRHQFKLIREAYGPKGLPLDGIESFVTILCQLVKNNSSPQHAEMAGNKLVFSGALVLLAPLMSRKGATMTLKQTVKEIIQHICTTTPTDRSTNPATKIISILKCNVIKRLSDEIIQIVEKYVPKGVFQKEKKVCLVLKKSKTSSLSSSPTKKRLGNDTENQLIINEEDQKSLLGSLQAFSAVCNAVREALVANQYQNYAQNDRLNGNNEYSYDRAYLYKSILSTATQFLSSSEILDSLFRVLDLIQLDPSTIENGNTGSLVYMESNGNSKKDRRTVLSACLEMVLEIIRKLAISRIGFDHLLENLAQNGGRNFKKVLHYGLARSFDAPVCSTALEFIREISTRQEAREGLTTSGAIGLFASFCVPSTCPLPVTKAIVPSKEEVPFLEQMNNKTLCLLGLIGIALFAKQTPNTSQDHRVEKRKINVQSLEHVLDHLYELLLELVSEKKCFYEKTALFLLHQNSLQILLSFLLQCTPSNGGETPYQNTKQRNIGCIFLARLMKKSSVAHACYSEECIEHLALCIQMNHIEIIENRIQCLSKEERFLHQLGTREAIKALSRLTRTHQTAETVQAQMALGKESPVKLRPSMTSKNVPLLPQAIVCDVVFRLHVLEDISCHIHVPNDGAEFFEIEVKLIRAAIELVGYLRPLPFGEEARNLFFLAAKRNHALTAAYTSVGDQSYTNIINKIVTEEEQNADLQVKYAQNKMDQLVKCIAPSLLGILRHKNTNMNHSLYLSIVDTCLRTLGRLASTNVTCIQLLEMNSLPIVLSQIPTFLANENASCSKVVEINSTVDDSSLVDVPTSLYTLVWKLCRVQEGRAELMKLYALPRILRRLQLVHPFSEETDDACKGEIAFLVSKMALVNTPEGNTSDIFLHLNVLSTIGQMLKNAIHDVFLISSSFSSFSSFSFSSSSSSSSLQQQQQQNQKAKRLHQRRQSITITHPKKSRFLNHAIIALDALCQDVLGCIPSFIKLDLLPFLMPLLSQESTHFLKQGDLRMRSLQHRAVNIIRSIASYPFGEFHFSLKQQKGLLEEISRIGSDFQLELSRNFHQVKDEKSIGEIARDILDFIKKQDEKETKQLLSNSVSPKKKSKTTITETKNFVQEFEFPPLSPVRVETTLTSSSPMLQRGKEEKEKEEEKDNKEEEVISGSRSKKVTTPNGSSSNKSLVTTTTTSLDKTSPSKFIVLPLSSVASVTSSSSSEVGIGRASVTIGIPSNVSLLDTRPSLSKPSSTNTTVYTFARPLDYLTSNNKQQSKPKPKQQKHISREEQEMINALMLDPLFLPPSTQYSSQSSTKKKKKQDIEQQHQQQQHPFSHENVKVGRDAVLIHSIRGHRGDQYIPSIGKI